MKLPGLIQSRHLKPSICLDVIIWYSVFVQTAAQDDIAVVMDCYSKVESKPIKRLQQSYVYIVVANMLQLARWNLKTILRFLKCEQRRANLSYFWSLKVEVGVARQIKLTRPASWWIVDEQSPCPKLVRIVEEDIVFGCKSLSYYECFVLRLRAFDHNEISFCKILINSIIILNLIVVLLQLDLHKLFKEKV